MSNHNIEPWRKFQKQVADFFKKFPECKVYTDYPVSGSRIKNVNVDVYVEFYYPQKKAEEFFEYTNCFVFTVIIECKFWKTKVTQEKIFALKTIVEDVGAERGYLITNKGVQSGVEEYLKRPSNIYALTPAELLAHFKMENKRRRMGDYVIIESGPLTAVCSDCGFFCDVPFKPTEGKPIFCRDCYSKRRKFW